MINTATPRLRVRPLVAALLLCGALPATAADNPQVANGVHLDVPPGTYTSSTGEVFRASGNGGSISGRDSVLTATAEGGTGRGVVAFGAGSLVTLDNSEIVVTGESGVGVEAASGGEVRIAGTRIEMQKRGFGVLIGTNSTGTLTDSTIIHAGANFGVLNSGALTLVRTTVLTSEPGSIGISAAGVSTELQDSVVRTIGNFANALAMSQGVTVQMAGTTLSTSGSNAAAVLVRSGGTLAVSGGTIATGGDDAAGIQSQVFGGVPATIGLDGVAITTFGARSAGIQLNGATALTVTGGSIDSVASAVIAGADSATFTGTRLTSTGDAASTLRLTDAAGSFQLTDTQLRASGADSWGADIAGRFEMAGGRLDSVQYGALRSDGGVVELSAGAQVSGGNGHLFDQASAAPTTLSMRGATQASGDIGFVPGTPSGSFAAATTVALDSGAVWTGATSATVTGLSIAGGSRWQLTAGSDVQALRVDNATVALSDPAAAGFHTLRVDGDLDGGGGTFALRARLGADGSPGDLLHVRGDVRGQFGLQVDNAGGAGGLTVEGIRLVQVDGASTGGFTLAGRAVAGAYEYFLFQGRPTVADGHWYLRSVYVPPPDPCTADPNGPGCTPPPDPCTANASLPGCPLPPDPCTATPDLPECRPPTPIYRPELAAYLANTSAAIDLFQYALHGQAGMAMGPAGAVPDRGAWVRADGRQRRLPGEVGQLSTAQESAVLRAGVDLLASDDGRAAVGVMAAHGVATVQAASRLTGYNARGRVQGAAVGVYASWVQATAQPGGAFASGWLQAGRYRNRVDGQAIAPERYDTRSWAGSVEGGYRWHLPISPVAALVVEPRVQATYTQLRGGDHREANGTVVAGWDQGVWRGQAGVRLAWRDTAGPVRVQPFIGVSAVRDSRPTTLALDQARFASAQPQDRYQVQLGAELALASGWSGTGLLVLERGGHGYRQHSGELGLRYRW
ncbi:autotransporter outer membrane beta-barrel domain-containing protein [Stenotrophomonas rhizophila]|uniref:autotransporter outer membrane beta-barrel domain-containing protein n=1 Tax=Stenotrophomonas rhizophila TaxID=216778 RepID=UPI000456CF1E|nr:autotransporter outer membrane beta-barrel domain-containing protein [Stenotrophomonas rhizophila]AHY58071.1 hypothetical protein DX03_05070 [Stenotrophomonas rhizophila]